jgi:hypothetical protein
MKHGSNTDEIPMAQHSSGLRKIIVAFRSVKVALFSRSERRRSFSRRSKAKALVLQRGPRSEQREEALYLGLTGVSGLFARAHPTPQRDT